MIELREMDNGAFTCPADPGEPGTHVPRISVTPTEGKLLRFLARSNRVLEIGTGLGVSTEYLASAARSLATIDIDPWVHDNVWPGLPQDVITIPDRNLLVFDHFDMVFIDGRHTSKETAADVDFALERIGHGLVVLHDAHLAEVSDALLDVDQWAIVPTAHGVAVRYVGWEDS